MFRSLIALLIASVLTLTGLAAPAYADSSKINGFSWGAKQVFDSHNTINIVAHPSDRSSPSFWDRLAKSVGDGALGTVGVVVGGAVVCYTLDGAAATVFPPAAALLPYCPAVGLAVGGGSAAVQNGVHAVSKAL